MRVLILSSSTGGGHDMRANAFEAWARLTPELHLETQILRTLDNGPALYRFGVGLYNWIQRRAPWAHHVYFNYLELTKPCGSVRFLFGAKKFGETLRHLRPDILLSVHGSLNHGYFDAARMASGDKLRCVTYCGELFGGYGFSRNWVNPNSDLFIGAVSETCDAAIQLKMPPQKTRIGGFLLRPEFYEPTLTDAAREHFIRGELGFDPQQFILLLSASSRGANNHRTFLDAISRAGIDVQTVVLCGKSDASKADVADWIRAHPKARVKIMPHDSNMALLLQSVSALVARPGTGATSEAILCRCPLLLNCIGGTMPQECITVKFCQKHQLARTLHRSGDLINALRLLMDEPAHITRIRDHMKMISPRSHPRDILRMAAGVA